MRVRGLIGCFIILGLMGCGKQSEDHPEVPTLRTDRDSLGFGREFNPPEGVWIGTAPQESLLLENQGLQPLVIERVDKSGDSAFSVDVPQKLEIEPLGHSFLRIIFTPTEPKDYSGSLTIVSNDPTTPQKMISLSGWGIAPPVDGGQ